MNSNNGSKRERFFSFSLKRDTLNVSDRTISNRSISNRSISISNRSITNNRPKKGEIRDKMLSRVSYSATTFRFEIKELKEEDS